MDYIKDLTDLQNLCRVCLTQSTVMIPLDSFLESNSKTTTPTVIAALEQVMSVKLITNEKQPSSICAMCKGLLKISYDLNVLFYNSQAMLTKQLNDVLISKINETRSKEVKEVAPVELIVGNSKYNLNDVMIVEDEEENDRNFEGFLNNLGSAITARFVNNYRNERKKPNISNYSVSLEKLDAFNDSADSVELSIKDTPTVNDCVDEFLITDNIVDLFIENDNSFEINEDVLKKLQNTDYINKGLVKGSYSCNICSVLCATKSRLKKHIQRYHVNNGKTYLCEVCGFISVFKKIEDCYNTLDGQDDLQEDVVKNYLFSCSKCDSVITTSDNFDDCEKEFSCQICGHVSHNRGSASYHKQKHFGKKYMCKICDKRYLNKESLRNHINKHKNIRNELCTVCGKTFNYKSALVYHMRIHTNERNYCCTFCDRRFYMLTSLKRHVRTHTGVRPYGCLYCEKRFFSLGEKRKHEMIHSGVRPFQCKYCNKGFTSIFNRKVHYMSHSGPHVCDHCSKSFIEISYLKIHMDTKHKDEKNYIIIKN